MTNKEIQAAADKLRALHRVPGILVISLESEACQFGFAFAETDMHVLLAHAPRVMREMADRLERQGRALITVTKATPLE